MTSGLPSPVSLDPPDGSARVVEQLATQVTAGAFGIGVLQAHLAGPVVQVPGWLGRDASTAVAQIAAVADVSGRVHAALTEGAERLEAHARLLADAETRIAGLRHRQDEDFAEARARLRVALVPPDGGAPAPGPAETILSELHAAEADRARSHAALLAEIDDDAVATARVLAAGSAAVGGTGGPGDADRVTAHLADLLPGWGMPELTARGAELARRLGDPVDVPELERLARGALPYAGSAAYAAALVMGLGSSGLRWLLTVVGEGQVSAGSDVTRLLAAVLGCAPPVADGDLVGGVLDDLRLDARDPDPFQDVVAIGMGEVLAVAFARPGTVGRPGLLTSWGSQILQREGTLRRDSPDDCRAVRGVTGMRSGAIPDPAEVVVELLARQQDGLAAASVLATPEAWDAVLTRSWPADDDSLARVVRLVGEAEGPAGDRSLLNGLSIVGAGLADGIPDGWDVDRATVAALSPVLGAALGRHPAAVAGLLTTAASARPVADSADAELRGLGYLTVDPAATRSIEAGLREWAAGQPVTWQAPGAVEPGSAVAGLAGFVAVREYGQRLAYALHGFEQRGEAGERQADWRMFVHMPLQVVGGLVGKVGQSLEPFAAHWVGADGTWDDGTDSGARLPPEVAAAIVSAELMPDRGAAAPELDRQARAAYLAAGVRLGAPQPPVSPDWDLQGALVGAIPDPEFKEGHLPGSQHPPVRPPR